MGEFIGEAITLVNLPFTALFGFVVIYWGLVAIGAWWRLGHWVRMCLISIWTSMPMRKEAVDR